jgi:hypothetical protein
MDWRLSVVALLFGKNFNSAMTRRTRSAVAGLTDGRLIDDTRHCCARNARKFRDIAHVHRVVSCLGVLVRVPGMKRRSVIIEHGRVHSVKQKLAIILQ